MRTLLALASIIAFHWMLQTQGIAAHAQRYPVDTTRWIIFQSSDPRPFFGRRVKSVDVTMDLMEQAEAMLRAFNTRCASRDRALADSLRQETNGRVTDNFGMVDLDIGYRQCLVGQDRRSDTLLHVNGICRADDLYWKQHWILMHDGGPCYWQAVINLTHGTIERLSVNGL